MISAVIHLYRRHKEEQSTLVGVVEPVAKEERLAFHDKDELWEILQLLSNEEEKEQVDDRS